jgi:hypothetical protein
MGPQQDFSLLQKRKITLNFTNSQNGLDRIWKAAPLTQDANHTNFSLKSHLPRF